MTYHTLIAAERYSRPTLPGSQTGTVGSFIWGRQGPFAAQMKKKLACYNKRSVKSTADHCVVLDAVRQN